MAPDVAHRLPPLLRQVIEAAGGFTLDRRGTAFIGRGIAVATDPGAALAFPADSWDDELIGDWLADATCQRDDDEHVGGWLDPSARRVWLDVVRVFDVAHRHQAFAMARRHGQRAVFDLSRSALVPLAIEGRAR
jgi:hypothetical protein